MKNLIKTTTTKLLAVPVLLTTLFSLVPTAIYAAGGTPYGPYGPHIPEDTGFASLDVFAIAGAVLYGAGIFFILYSKFFQAKLVK